MNVAKLLNNADTLLTNLLVKNKVVSAVVTVVLVLYAGLAAPKLSPWFVSLFEHPIMKALVMFIILVVRNYNPTIALIAVIGFLLTLHTLSQFRTLTMARDVKVLQSKALQAKNAQQVVESEPETEEPVPAPTNNIEDAPAELVTEMASVPEQMDELLTTDVQGVVTGDYAGF